MNSDSQAANWRNLNHAWWDERAPLHAQSEFYRQAAKGLENFEWEDLGSIQGLEVVHPQCHIGTDTLSLARNGANVVGLDFSATAIHAAGQLATASGLAPQCEWVVSDVYDAPLTLQGRKFDLVYTGKGALCWLPDMDRWAGAMWELCRPAGHLYLCEFHPLMDQLSEQDMGFERSYFPIGGEVYSGVGSYAVPEAQLLHNTAVDFIHPISEVIQALVTVGFCLVQIREFPLVVFERWPWLVPRGDGVWEMPEDQPSIPMMYSLLLSKP